MSKNSERDSFRRFITSSSPTWLFLVMAMAASISTIASFFFVDQGDPVVRLKTSELAEIRSNINQQEAAITEAQTQIDAINKSMQQLVKDADNIEIATLGKQLEKLSGEFDTLRKSLGGDVERSLSVALLRKDIDASKIQFEASLDASTRSVDRVYDQNKWFLGLMATMTLSVIGLSISVIKFGKKPKEEG